MDSPLRFALDAIVEEPLGDVCWCAISVGQQPVVLGVKGVHPSKGC